MYIKAVSFMSLTLDRGHSLFITYRLSFWDPHFCMVRVLHGQGPSWSVSFMRGFIVMICILLLFLGVC